MSKNIKNYIISISFLLILVFGFYVSKSLSTSYAIDPDDDFPTTTFNISVSSDKVNYIKDGLTAASKSDTNQNKYETHKSITVDSKPVYIIHKAKEFAGSTEDFEIISDDTPASITDKSLLYIINHGYNTTNTTNNIFTTGTYGNVTDNSIKYYITQMAIWLYIYENRSDFATTYCIDDSCILPSNVRTVINDASTNNSFKYLKYITDLVDKANNYSGAVSPEFSALQTSNLSYTISETNKKLITEEIQPKSIKDNDNYLDYSVTIEDTNDYGVYITDKNNNKITDMSHLTGSFKVVVPLKDKFDEMDLTSVVVNVYGRYMTDVGYNYRVTDSPNGLLNDSKVQRYSNITVAYVPTGQSHALFKLFNIVKISKVDITNSEELPGAKIKITKGDDDELVDEYTSEATPHYLYLEDGSYKLCETAAPEGYELNTECINFTVDNKNIKTVTMTNKPVDIPDTGLFKSNIPLVIGIALLVIGGLSVMLVFMRPIKEKI